MKDQEDIVILAGSRKPKTTNIYIIIGSSLFFATALTAILLYIFVFQQKPQPPDTFKPTLTSIMNASFSSPIPYQRLAYMCNTYGPRLSGSVGLENAIDYIYNTCLTDGFDVVKKDPVMVPTWVRGNEELFITQPYHKKLPFLGLGGSIGTNGTLIANVIVVKSFAELDQKKDQVAGKIVVYNPEYKGYGGTVEYRALGAENAAKYGAVAALTRSITPFSLGTPHTGGQVSNKIPAGAITVEDAATLQFLQDNGKVITLSLMMEGSTKNDSQSYNVYAQINGSTYPEKIIVMGGHIDSWDVGTGAQDDGAGVLACWEALRLIKVLNLKPKVTIRFIAWTNEENGARGASQYVVDHLHEINDTILAFEADIGILSPFVFQYGNNNNENGYSWLNEIYAKYYEGNADLLLQKITKNGGGVDIAPLERLGVPVMSLSNLQSDKYFWYHHSESDQVNAVDEVDLKRAASSIAFFMYLFSETNITLRKST